MTEATDKLEAIKALCFEFGSNRRSRSALSRVRKAGKALGLTEDELLNLEVFLVYRAPEGELYPAFDKKRKGL